MTHWHIGCSGFHYKHWKEIFYPKGLAQKNWFSFYCDNFKTLELNVTFYRFPELSFLETWYTKSPSDFIFAVKAPRIITHYKKFIDCSSLLSDFYATIKEGLNEKLGPVLFQLPPKYDFTPERLDRIINNTDGLFTNVLEFRHPSWWNTEVYTLLSKHKISFCGMSHPALPEDIIQNTATLYYRMHGVPLLYHSLYTERFLKDFIKKVEVSSATTNAYIYFNNDIDVNAVTNAKEMIALADKIKKRSS